MTFQLSSPEQKPRLIPRRKHEHNSQHDKANDNQDFQECQYSLPCCQRRRKTIIRSRNGHQKRRNPNPRIDPLCIQPECHQQCSSCQLACDNDGVLQPVSVSLPPSPLSIRFCNPNRYRTLGSTYIQQSVKPSAGSQNRMAWPATVAGMGDPEATSPSAHRTR